MKKLYFLLFLMQSTFIVFSQVSTYGLVGNYPFNGNADDQSVNKNNGVVTGATLTTDRYGNANSAYLFDVVNSYIQIPANASLNLTDSLSISLWVYLTTENTSGGHHLIVKGDNTSKEYSLVINKKTLKGGLNRQDSESYVISNSGLVANTWTHIVSTYSYPTAKLYINGVLNNTGIANSHIISSNTPLFIGSILPATALNTTKGKIDDVLIYNRVLSSYEIQKLYCTATSSTITMEACGNYIWNGIKYTTSGNYTKTGLINNGGCDSTANLKLTIKSIPTAIATPASIAICTESKTNIALASIPAGATFTWTAALVSGTVSGASASLGNTIAQVLSGNGVTNFKITPSFNGCLGSTIIASVTVNPKPTPSFTLPNTLSNKAASYTLIGMPAGGVFSEKEMNKSVINPSLETLGSHTITYKYKDGNGCSNSLTKTVLIMDTVGTVCHVTVTDTLRITSKITTGLNELPVNFGMVKVYPNPTSDVLNVVYDNPNADFTIRLANAIGSEVYVSKLNKVSTQIYIDGYSKGLYMLQVIDTSNKVLETKKIVIE